MIFIDHPRLPTPETLGQADLKSGFDPSGIQGLAEAARLTLFLLNITCTAQDTRAGTQSPAGRARVGEGIVVFQFVSAQPAPMSGIQVHSMCEGVMFQKQWTVPPLQPLPP
jgi:hypothetical protein